MSTRSYFSRFILFTAPTPSTATSIVHPKICKNLLDTFLLTASSSTSSTLGGTAHPGTYVDLRTRSVCALPGRALGPAAAHYAWERARAEAQAQAEREEHGGARAGHEFFGRVRPRARLGRRG